MPPAAWPLFRGALLVILATEALEGDADATRVVLGLAVLLLAYGLSDGATHTNDSLAQAIAMVGIDAAAAIAL